MRANNVKWGFLACLIERKDGRSARLKFPEELEEFGKKLDLNIPDISGWSEIQKEEISLEDQQRISASKKKAATKK